MNLYKEQPEHWFWGTNYLKELPLIPYDLPVGARVDHHGIPFYSSSYYGPDDKRCCNCGGPLADIYFSSKHDSKTGQLIVTLIRRCISSVDGKTYRCPSTKHRGGGYDY